MLCFCETELLNSVDPELCLQSTFLKRGAMQIGVTSNTDTWTFRHEHRQVVSLLLESILHLL